jgi:hypothetical protein
LRSKRLLATKAAVRFPKALAGKHSFGRLAQAASAGEVAQVEEIGCRRQVALAIRAAMDVLVRAAGGFSV